MFPDSRRQSRPGTDRAPIVERRADGKRWRTARGPAASREPRGQGFPAEQPADAAGATGPPAARGRRPRAVETGWMAPAETRAPDATEALAEREASMDGKWRKRQRGEGRPPLPGRGCLARESL